MVARDALSKAQFVYASPQRQTEIRDAVEPLLPASKSAKTRGRNQGVIRALTFSGVPAEHIRGMTGISYRRSDSADAQYSRTVVKQSRHVVDASIRVDLPTADALTINDREARRVLIHEVGHHVHATNDDEGYSDYHRPGYSGYVEAVAENYADRRARSKNSRYDEIVNATPDDEAGWDTRRRFGVSNVAAYNWARDGHGA